MRRLNPVLTMFVLSLLIFLPQSITAQPGPGPSGDPEFHLAAKVDTGHTVILEWGMPSGTVAQYYIFRVQLQSTNSIPDSSAFSLIDSTGPDVHRYVDAPRIPDAGASFVYRVAARMITGPPQHSNFAVILYPSSDAPTSLRLVAEVHPPDSVLMKWERPENVDVLKYYILAAFTSDPSPVLSPTGLHVIDSTTMNWYGLDAPDGSRYGIVSVLALTASGRHIPSNGVPIVFPGAAVEPPRLEGEVTDTGSVKLFIRRHESLAGGMVYIFRYAIDTPSVVTFAVPWVLIDSTTANDYLDDPPQSELGFVYVVRMRAGSHMLESNAFVAILRQRLYLRVFPDVDGSIRLQWTPVLRHEAEGFVVWRQVLTDSSLTVSPTGGGPVDTVRGTEWKDRPNHPDAHGYAYKVSALGVGETVESAWHLIRMHRPTVQPFLLGVRLDIHGKVNLYWNAPFIAPPQKFYIYRGALERNTHTADTSSIALIDSVPGSQHEYVDMPPLDVSNAFVYLVFAVNAQGVFARTNPVAVVFGDDRHDRDVVRITSEPVGHGEVGEEYVYDAEAVSSDSGAVLRWKLLHGPDGMTVDSVTGVVRWLPITRGWYKVVLGVASNLGGGAAQEYGLAIAGGTGSVAGTVYDEQGQPLSRVLVKLFKRDALTPFEYVRVTDSAGFYMFDRVEVGSYVAYAVDLTGTHKPEWWFDHHSPEDADPVIVADSATTTVDFILESRLPDGAPLTVEGTVSDTLDAPIVGAVVVFARAEFMLNSAKHLGEGEERGENLRDLVDFQVPADASVPLLANVAPIVVTTTDAQGSYSVDLAPGAYIAFSYAPGFRKIFYDGKTDLLRANILRLRNDTSGIDFRLIPVSDEPLASISGGVYDTTGLIPVPSRVIAFRFTGDFRRIDSYYTDAAETGEFTLSDLPPGDYILLALPLGHYAPSFYSLDGPTLRWKLATRLTVNGADIGGVNILVRPLSRSVAGFTSIDGSVETNDAGGGERVLKRTAVAGVDGSIVVATTSDGSIAGYAVTDESGSYSIPGIAPGSYTVTADRFGFDEPTTSQADPTYDENGNPLPAEVLFNVSYQTTSVEETMADVPADYSLGQNFPNPFNPTTQFSFSIPKQGRVTVEVYNLLGQRIATLFDGMVQAGKHTAVWNGRASNGAQAATGIYFYTLKAAAVSLTKRMVLLK